MDMTQLRELLEQRRGELSVDDWAYAINDVIKPKNPEDRMKPVTLYAYLNGNRNIAGKGIKLLAQYFYRLGDYQMVDAISKIALGIPYPSPPNVSN
ncbi:MAG: hypothetical protein GY805_35865 [Chloroflexi bacterium]|nr:hypothetical protein [Chloroflexota bacterium]